MKSGRNKNPYKQYQDPQQAKPEFMHPYYEEWAEMNGYLKRNLDEACVKIAELVVENRELKAEIKENKLPTGQMNSRRDKIQK